MKTNKDWQAGYDARSTDIQLAVREVLRIIETPKLPVKSDDADAVLEAFLRAVNKGVATN